MKRILIAVSVLVSSLLLAATAFAVVQSGNSGWRWSNPQPQGNTLVSADFVGDRGYAAGAAGTLLRSDNKGSTWSSVRTGLLTDVSLVRAITADSFVFAAGCSLRRSDDGGATITRLPWTPSDDSCNPEIQSFSFPDLDNGYLMLKDGTVYKTADRGQTWSLRTGVPGTAANGGSAAPGDINFLSATTGVASAANGIYRTTDSGSSWTLVNGVSAGAVRRFTFLDATKGFAVSSGSTVLATVDGGLTYAPVVSPGGDLTGIDCESVTNCLVTQADGKIISRTIDGGATWAAVTPSSSGVFSVTFATGSRAVAVGGSGATEVSDDSGATWTSVSVLVNGAFNSLRVTSPTTAYAFGQTGTFARTTDGGASWTKIGVSTAHNIADLAFPDATNGFALDDAGTVLRTTNSGASWQFLDIGTVSEPRAIYAKSPTSVVLAGPKGVRTSKDSGNSFSLNTNPVLKKSRLDSIDVAGSSIVAFGPSNVFVGDGAGKKWKAIKLPRKRRVAALDFINAKSGYFIDQSDELWFTGTAGKKWKMISAFRHGFTRGSLPSLTFSNAKQGFVVIGDGTARRTDDGGKTWATQYPLASADGGAADLRIAGSGLTSFLLGAGTSNVVTTDTGGKFGAPSVLTIKPAAKSVKSGTKLKITGKLSPARGGATVSLSFRSAAARPGESWSFTTATVAANGSFTSNVAIRKDMLIIGSWTGDAGLDGDASPAVIVKVKRKR